MNVVQVLNVKLQRNDQNVSWGFNVQGGKEFNCPLVIQRVTANSLADRCSIRPGDYILRVGTLSTEHLTHNQSRDSIVRQGNSLELTLQRGAPPRPEDYHAKLDFPQHQLMTPENVEPKATLSPQVGVQLSKNKALLTQSYNSPMGLYSSQNIADTLVSSIKNVDYQQPAPPAQAQPQQPLHLFQQHQNHHQMPIQSSFYNQFSSSLQRSASSQTTQQQQQQHQHQQQHYAESHHQQQYQQSHSAHNSRPVSVQQSMQFENYHTPQVLSPSATPIPRTTSAASTTSSFRHQQDSMAHIPLPAAAHHVLTPIPAVRPSSVATSIAGTIVHTTTLPKPPPGPRNPMFSAAGSAVLNVANPSLLPNCATCATVIRGPFISAIGKIWCPHHFVCAHPSCGINLENVGFVEENGKLYCEKDFEQFLAPNCFKCKGKILNECCNALEKHFHPECFVCTACKQKIGTGNFHMEDGVPYCEKDYTKLFATKCAGCDFPIEAGDKFFEALSQNWHVECFTCTHCHVPLHTTGFATKLNKPYCKKHAY